MSGVRVHQSDSEEDFESAPEDDGGEQHTPADDSNKSEMTPKTSNVATSDNSGRPTNEATGSEMVVEKHDNNEDESVATEPTNEEKRQTANVATSDNSGRPTNEATGSEMVVEKHDNNEDESVATEPTNEEKRQTEFVINDMLDPSGSEMQTSPNANADEKRTDNACDEYEQEGKESRETTGQLQKETEMKLNTEADDSTSTEQVEKCEQLPQATDRFAQDIKDALKAVTDMEPKKPASSGWGWGSWISSTASALGQGLQSAIHSVEETLGIPEPSELAKDSEVIEMEEVESTQVVEDEPVKVEKADRDEVSELKKVEEDEASGFSVWSGVSALSSAIAHKSSELMSGGIDALEAIGRKTMDVLSEGDPGRIVYLLLQKQYT
jgi:hypothetical protein